MWENTQFWTGIAGLVFGIGLSAAMYILEKQPRKSFKPRIFPTTLFLFIGLAIALGAAVHILATAGFTIPQQR